MSVQPQAPAAAPAAPAAPSAPAPAGPPPTIGNFMRVMEAKNAAPPPPQTILPTPPQPEPPKPPEALLGTPPEPETPPESTTPELEPETPPEPAQLADTELLAKARDWQSSEYLPEDFLGKFIEVEVKQDDGTKRTEVVPVREMRDGYLRQSALSRAQTRIHHERQQMQQRDTNVRAHFEKIRDPEVFLREYEDRGYGEVLEAVAMRIAERRVSDRDLINAAGIAVMQRYGCDQNDRRVHDAMRRAEDELKVRRANAVELRRIQAERDALAQRSTRDDRETNVSELAATMRKQLDQLRPMAFRALRIHDNPSTQKEFARHLLAQMEVAGNYEVTRDAVMTAAQTLSEELADARRAAAPTPPPRPAAPRALSPTSVQAGRAVANGATRGRKRPSEMMSDLFGKP